jgi:hypothetical protein
MASARMITASLYGFGSLLESGTFVFRVSRSKRVSRQMSFNGLRSCEENCKHFPLCLKCKFNSGNDVERPKSDTMWTKDAHVLIKTTKVAATAESRFIM